MQSELNRPAMLAAAPGSATKMDCYVGIKPCGCMVAWVYDSKEHPKDVAKSVAQFIKDGYRVESANTDDIRSKLGPCKCKSPNDSRSAMTPPETPDSNHDAPASLAAPDGWAAMCDDNLPPLDEIVWLWDGHQIWIGGRADDCDGWLWGNTYGTIWHNGVKWDGDLETDDDYKPTHWMRLPEPPNDGTQRPGSPDGSLATETRKPGSLK